MQQPRPARPTSWPVISGPVPGLTEFFSARQQTGIDTAAIAGRATGTLPASEQPGCYLLTGPPGCGKTQLAAALAWSLWQSRDIDLLVWVPASGRTALLAGYAQAAGDASEIPDGPAAAADGSDQAVPGGSGQPAARPAGTAVIPGRDSEARAAGLLAWLAATDRPWLVVLDDVTDTAALAGLWPQGMTGRVMLTSRLPPAVLRVPAPRVKSVQLGGFSRREAMNFLTARLYVDPSQRIGALDLAEDLGCWPVALAQATAVVASSGIDCRTYQTMLAQRRAALGQAAPAQDGAAAPPVTWSLSLDRAEQLPPTALARPVLAMLALLDPNGVPGTVLTSASAREFIGTYSAGRAAATGQDVRAVIGNLVQAGLIVVDDSPARTVQMHEVVQACIRQVLPPAVRDQAGLAAAGAIVQAWDASCEDLLLGQALRDCTDRLSQAIGDLLWTPDAHPVLARVGESLDAAHLSGSAAAYWRSLIETSSRLVGPEHAQSLHYMQQLASSYAAAGQIDLAVDTQGKALAELEQSLGPGHPKTLTARTKMAHACLASGQVAAALQLFERSLAAREWVLGPDHPDTLAARSDLAGAYRMAGRLEDSIAAFRQTLGDQELILGEDHPETITTRASLAHVIAAAGRPKEALPFYVRVITDRQRIQGADHPDTLTARGNLAAAYYTLGKLKDAIALLEKILADRERVQGADHPDTLTTRGNLASAYHAAGRLAIAIRMYERTLADCERVLGPLHENTLTSRGNLASAYYSARRMADAVALFQRTLSECERVLPADHPLTRTIRESLQAAGA
ncbi:MAG TPA: hypothetical protein DEH11_10850 [Actinobacteria bacterium]|nr:hypothetical protein [Actinomycetota bacterium]